MDKVRILDMKKEFVVKSIDSAPDGAPYVVVSLSSIKDLKEGTQNPQPPFEIGRASCRKRV